MNCPKSLWLFFQQRLTQVLQLKDVHPVSILVLLIVVQLISSGCSVVQIVDALGPETQVLREGEKQFAMGNYHKAAMLFKEVHTSDVDLQTKNAALYSLACTRMITAKNDKQFMEAVNILKKLKKSYGGGLYIENPSLIITALEKRLSVIEMEKATVKKQARKNRVVISRQKEKISEMQNTLKILQHQITELEVIDQQIQEKKKPL